MQTHISWPAHGLRRRHWLSTMGALALGARAQGASAAFPQRPVHLTVANTAGSPPDLLARLVGGRLSAAWGQPVVVDNRTGAGGILAADAAAKAAPDGHSLLVGADGPITILPALQQKLPYDPQRDLQPVAALGQIDFVLVAHPGTGFRSLADFVRAAKARPGRYNYASAGNGSPQQFAMELLKQQAGMYLTHIPYRAGPPGLADVVAGQVDVMFIALGPALPHLQSGRLVALATGGSRRHALLPQVPAVAETYEGFTAGTWFGLFAPSATPQPVVRQIASEVERALAPAAVRAELAAQGIDATGWGPERFGREVAAETARYAALVRQAGIRLDA